MKKIFKVLGIVALVAVIGFSMSCGGGDDNGDDSGDGSGGGDSGGTTVSVTGVTLNKTSLSLAVGGSETLTATVAPTDATNKNVTWTSSDTTKATVANNGLVTAVAAGTATITVTTADGNKTATCVLTVTGGSGGGGGSVNIDMVSIPAGTFTMGSPTTEPYRYSDETQHSVTLSAFSMSKYLVTQEQYQAVMGTNPSHFSSSPQAGETQGKRPVERVSWYAALVFCNKLSTSEGLTPAYSIKGSTDPASWGTVPTINNSDWDAVVIVAGSTGYRLPTEAQWEYACRAGTTTAYNTGATISDSTGWYERNSGNKTHQVGLKSANAWGLYDMPGNVWEWCWDWYGSYPSEAQTNPLGTSSGTDRVLRGGSWIDLAVDLRSAARYYYDPYFRGNNPGFRLVRPYVSVVSVTGVTLNKTSLSLAVGGSETLTATVAPTDATNKNVTWTSSDTTKATVVNGAVTAVAAGSATITVKTADGNKTATCVLTVTGGSGGGGGSVNIDMVSIPAGTFTMGSPTTEPNRYSDETQHSVTLSAFKMSKYLVTQEQYQAVMGTNPSSFSSSPQAGETQGKRPVEMVSWYDALVFCNKLSTREGLTPAYSIKGSTDPTAWGTVPTSSNSDWNAVVIVAGSTGYRLPTEAQWEYACRAGTTTAYNTGATISDNTGWYEDNSGEKTHEVGLKPANAWGLYDMHGNVWEWCWDWYGSYSSEAQTNPMGASSGTYRGLRGGSWNNSAEYLRSAFRVSGDPGSRGVYLGFRLVRP